MPLTPKILSDERDPHGVYWFGDRKVKAINPRRYYGRADCQNFGEPGRTDYRLLNLLGIQGGIRLRAAFRFGSVAVKDRKQWKSSARFQSSKLHRGDYPKRHEITVVLFS